MRTRPDRYSGVLKTPALFLFSAKPAFSEVCDKVRPSIAVDGYPVSARAELLTQVGSPAFLIIVLLLVLGYFRPWALIACGFACAIQAMIPFFADEVVKAAVQEGCVGPPYLFQALCAAICGATGFAYLKTRHAT